MKKIILSIAIASILGVCSPTEIIAKTPEKTAILLPINNTNDQRTAELLWNNLSTNIYEHDHNKLISPEKTKVLIQGAGYSFGDQLTQLDSPEKRIALQNKMGTDGLIFITVDDVNVSLKKNPLKPTTIKNIKGKAVLYVDGIEEKEFNIEGIETEKISGTALKTILIIAGSIATDHNGLATVASIAAISDPVIRGEVIDGVLALSGPLGNKIETLLFEKGILKENPYKKAIDNAVASVAEDIEKNI
ncbi:hypothetical protein [Ilyobacter sp.]|jgi:translation initiation factor 1 (eIF-1/SUI1)|uniref:hypothetical protein n=1 Tax=Ilyobacter sp. TaxID=3100343 RepID=UPI00356B0213